MCPTHTQSLNLWTVPARKEKGFSMHTVESHESHDMSFSLYSQLHIQNVRCCGTTLTAGLAGLVSFPRNMIICCNNNDTLIVTEILFGLHTENCQSSVPDF